MTFRIRAADLARDKPALLSFIMGSQVFEHAIEPNRRLDPAVAAEHFVVLENELAERGGAMLVADDANGVPVGWGVVQEEQDNIYVVPEERRIAYISELFVEETRRGSGVGQALIVACEDWAKARGIGIIRIGVLAANHRAAKIYRQAGYADYAIELRKYLK